MSLGVHVVFELTLALPNWVSSRPEEPALPVSQQAQRG
jgi:hypothetical protein